MNEPKIAISEVVMCDADYDEEIRFAGAGVLRDDTEYQYPPAKWGESSMAHKIEGPPYEVKSVTSWPAEVDRRLSHIEALVHKAINPVAPDAPDLRTELRAAYATMRTIAGIAEDAHDGNSVAMRELFRLIDEMRDRYEPRWNGGL